MTNLLIYIDKYRYIFDFHGHFSDRFHAAPVERIASDMRFDTYEARLAQDLLAINYLDTVMNYAFQGAVAGFFARGTLTPEGFSQQLAWTRARYKLPAWQVLWNLGVSDIYYGDETGRDLNSLALRAGMHWDPTRQNR